MNINNGFAFNFSDDGYSPYQGGNYADDFDLVDENNNSIQIDEEPQKELKRRRDDDDDDEQIENLENPRLKIFKEILREDGNEFLRTSLSFDSLLIDGPAISFQSNDFQYELESKDQQEIKLFFNNLRKRNVVETDLVDVDIKILLHVLGDQFGVNPSLTASSFLKVLIVKNLRLLGEKSQIASH